MALLCIIVTMAIVLSVFLFLVYCADKFNKMMFCYDIRAGFGIVLGYILASVWNVISSILQAFDTNRLSSIFVLLLFWGLISVYFIYFKKWLSHLGINENAKLASYRERPLSLGIVLGMISQPPAQLMKDLVYKSLSFPETAGAKSILLNNLGHQGLNALVIEVGLIAIIAVAYLVWFPVYIAENL